MLARPGLPSIAYVRADSAAQVHRLLREQGTLLMMGGTDLLPQMRDGSIRPKTIVDLKELPGMEQVTLDADGLTIGAAVTMNQVAQNPDVLTTCPALAQAAGSVASYQIRNRATIGGNLCNASPAADTALPLILLDAVVDLASLDAERISIRQVPIADLFTGPGSTVLAPNEILTHVRFRPQAETSW